MGFDDKCMAVLLARRADLARPLGYRTRKGFLEIVPRKLISKAVADDVEIGVSILRPWMCWVFQEIHGVDPAASEALLNF